jgi:hypothetical protein
MPPTKSPKKSTTRVDKAEHGEKPGRLNKAFDPAFTALLVVGVLAVGMLIAAEQRSSATKEGTNAARADVAPDIVTDPTTMKSVTPSTAPVAMSTANRSMSKTQSVTITGCLERADAAFRLKDTAGDEAPKVRSWKSGFLRKGPASIELIDAVHTLKLSNHVGRRVSVSGTLVDREMHVRSLRLVSPSCAQRAGA